jgi:hypothetical protein
MLCCVFRIGFARLQAGAWAAAAASWRQSGCFEAGELFPLFPRQAGPFREGAPLKKYWGLHPPAADLEALVRSVAARARPGATPAPEELRAGWLGAASEMASLLAWLRRASGRLPAPQRAGADTLLLLLLAETGAAAGAEALAAEVGGSCAVEHAAAALGALGRHVACAALHAAAGDARSAVATLRALAAGELTESPAADGAVVEAALRGASPAAAAAEAAATMLARGAGGSDVALALDALPWLLDASPAAAARLATAPHPAPPLPRAPVLELLRPRGGEPLVAYLEHLVAADHAAWSATAETVTDGSEPGPSSEAGALQTELGLALFSAVAASRAADDERSAARTRLRGLLARRRPSYDPAALLRSADAADAAGTGPPLLRERVLLHAAAGDHAAALALLVRRLRDCDAAEAYAARRPTPAARAAAHLALLRLYLHPGPDGSEPPPELFARAAALLAARGDALDGPGVLAELPDDAALARLLPLLSGLLRASAHTRRSGAVAAALERRRHQVAAQELAELRQQALLLDENTACGACHARLARPGELLRPFARYPTGLLACHRCSASLAAPET